MAKKLLMDLDGVLANFYRWFSSYLNQHYGTTLDTTHEPHFYNFDEWGGGVNNIDVKEATRKWIASGGYRNMAIYPGAAEFFNELNEIFDVYIVTAREEDLWGNIDPSTTQRVKQDTFDWLKDYGLKSDKVFFHRDKVSFCINNGIRLMVEDKLATALEGAKNGIDTILIDRYWNQSPQRFRIFRAMDYAQAVKHLKNLSKQR
jgi:uncharacterized HAD superfamily protein